MNRLFLTALVCLLALASATRADGPDEQFVQAYRLIQQGDELRTSGQPKAALERYYLAESELRKIQRMAPDWQASLIRYRLKSVGDLIAPLAKQFPDVQPPSGAPVPSVVAPPANTKTATKGGAPAPAITGPVATAISESAFQRQLSEKNQEIIRLRMERESVEAEYKAKLKEALAARPTGGDPNETLKLEERLKSLQKENDVQKLNLDKASKAAAQAQQSADSLAKERANLEKKVSELTDRNENKTLRTENSQLKSQIADVNRQLGNLPKSEELQREILQLKAELKAQSNINESLVRENKKMELLLTDLPDLKPTKP